MNGKGNSSYLAALNAAWQRYARAMEQQVDTLPTDTLSRDLATSGIVESMLEYDPTRTTFFLPMTIEMASDGAAAEIFAEQADSSAASQSGEDNFGCGRSQLI